MTAGRESTDVRALRAVAVQFWINGAVISSYIPRLPEIRDTIGASLSTIGQVITVATLGGLIGSVWSGRTVERVGTRRTMIGGAIGLIVLLPFVSLASSAWNLLIVLAAIAAVDVVVDVAMNIQGSNISARRPSPVMNRLHGMFSVGTVFGGLTASIMAALDVPLGWHLLGASIVLAGALLYVAPGLLDDDGKPPTSENAPPARQSAAPRSLLVFGILGAVAIIPEMVTSDWSAFRLRDDLGTSGGVAGLGFVAFTSGMVTGRLLGDSLVERVGKDHIISRAVAVAVAGLAIAGLVDASAAVFIGLCVAGLGVSVLFPELYDAAAQDSTRPGASLGAMTAGSRVAMLAAPAAVGFLADTDSFDVGLAMAVVTIPSALLVWRLAR